MAIIVSDTSPVRALHHLSLIHVLDALYREVIVPPAVARELEQPRPRFAPVLLKNYTFLRVQAPSDRRRVAELGLLLDPGESEAIALAEELKADELLIDEMAGRWRRSTAD